MTGPAILVVLAAMGAGWLIRNFLLKALRERHPEEYARLGQPSTRQLTSLMPRDRELQVQFWKYLWEGRIFAIDDGAVRALAWAARIADVALVAGAAALLWSAWPRAV